MVIIRLVLAIVLIVIAAWQPASAEQWPVYCDFGGRWNTYDGNIGNTDTGQVWDMRTYDNGMVKTLKGQIRNGALVSEDMSTTIYATLTLPFVPARMGAEVSFLPGNASSAAAGGVTLAISKDDKFIVNMGAHLTIIPTGWYFWVRDSEGFNLVCWGRIDPPFRLDGTPYPVEYSIVGNTITLSINGKKYAYFNTRISPNLGPYCFWEVYYHDKTATSAMAQINKIWASSSVASVFEGMLIGLQ